MKAFIWALVLALAGTAGIARAEPAPWEAAAAVLSSTEADLSHGGGFATLEKHLQDLDDALAGADAALAAAKKGSGDTVFVLTDGPASALLAMMAAAADANKNPNPAAAKTVAVANPYPLIAFYLGAYYNERGRFEDAAKVLGRGLELDTVNGIPIGATRPTLFAERAVALARLKRFDEALTSYDEGLKLEKDDSRMRARLYRGRGSVLIDLDRLDDAEASLRESLKIEPGNAMALNEIEYIARLRAGGAKAPGTSKLADPPKQ